MTECSGFFTFVDTCRCHRPSAVQDARHDDGVLMLRGRNLAAVEVRVPYLVDFASLESRPDPPNDLQGQLAESALSYYSSSPAFEPFDSVTVDLGCCSANYRPLAG